MAIKFDIKKAWLIRASDLRVRQMGKTASGRIIYKVSEKEFLMFDDVLNVVRCDVNDYEVSPLPSGTTITITSEI